MTAAAAATLPAGLDPTTAQHGTGGHLVYAETEDGAWAVMLAGRTWTVIRLRDRACLQFEPNVDQALAGIASGWAERELNLRAARAVGVNDLGEVLARARARVRRGDPLPAGLGAVLLAELDRVDQVLAAVCRQERAGAAR